MPHKDPSRNAKFRCGYAKRYSVVLSCVSLVLSTIGCSTPQIGGGNYSAVNNSLACRTGHASENILPCRFLLPPDVLIDDGVSEDEAIATALTNNSAFQSTLTQLGMAEGDRVQAGLLTNPNFATFIPVGPKQWEWTLFVPLEAFVLRPERLALAENQYESTAHQLVQNGLNLVRDVRVAHANLALAQAQYDMALEAVKIRQGIVDITEKQLENGDISRLEATSAQVEVLNSEANAALLKHDIEVARSRLALLMGLPPEVDSIEAELLEAAPIAVPESQFLIDEALANRPDAHAARWAVCAAQRRAQLSRWQWLRVDAIVDANARGTQGYEVGPGIRFDLPIFNRNQGGIRRSDAELTQAMHNRDAIQDQIVQEVRTANAQWIQSHQQLEALDQHVLPAMKEALQIAEKGFADGGTDYLLVLQTSSQYVNARIRLLDQRAALLRAQAELERSVGARLQPAMNSLPTPVFVEE